MKAKISYKKHDKDQVWDAKFIRDKLDLGGLSQIQVVNKINDETDVSMNTGEFSQIITGKKRPKFPQLEVILNTLHFSEEDIQEIRSTNKVVDALYAYHELGF